VIRRGNRAVPLQLEEPMRNCRKEVESISGKDLCDVLRNFFSSCKTVFQAGGQYFEIQLYARGITDAKFPVDVGFVCDKAPLTAALLRDKVMRPLCIPLSYGQVGIPQR
jgi:hypothetical protein